jgi:hypothetical protein
LERLKSLAFDNLSDLQKNVYEKSHRERLGSFYDGEYYLSHIAGSDLDDAF